MGWAWAVVQRFSCQLVPEVTSNTTEVFSVLIDNIEAEVCGIALAMDVAIKHYATIEASPDRESLFILSLTVKQPSTL